MAEIRFSPEAHIRVPVRKQEGKAHLHHDKQGMEVPYDDGRILFQRNPVSRGCHSIYDQRQQLPWSQV